MLLQAEAEAVGAGEDSTMGAVSVTGEMANLNQPESVGHPPLSWTQCGGSLQGQPLALLLPTSCGVFESAAVSTPVAGLPGLAAFDK